MTPVYEELQDEQAAHREVARSWPASWRGCTPTRGRTGGREVREARPAVGRGTLGLAAGRRAVDALRHLVDLPGDADRRAGDAAQLGRPGPRARPAVRDAAAAGQRHLVPEQPQPRRGRGRRPRGPGDRHPAQRGRPPRPDRDQPVPGVVVRRRWDELEDVATLVDDEDVQSRVLARVLVGLVPQRPWHVRRDCWPWTTCTTRSTTRTRLLRCSQSRGAAGGRVGRLEPGNRAGRVARSSRRSRRPASTTTSPCTGRSAVEYSLAAGDVDRAERLLTAGHRGAAVWSRRWCTPNCCACAA